MIARDPLSNVGIIFPGQGAQSVGMGKDVSEALPAARELFDRANDILGFDLSEICFNGPDEKLNSTEFAQAALFCAAWQRWRN